MKLPIASHIEKITPYPPGTPQDEVERKYGIKNSIKLASNENPYSPSSAVLTAITESLAGLNRYPDGSCYALTAALAEKHGVKQTEVVLGSGSDDLIDCLIKVFVEPGVEVISSQPSFLMYSKGVEVAGGINTIIPLKNIQQEMRHNLTEVLARINNRTRLIFLDNPNNPTGSIIPPAELYTFLSELPEEVVVVLDEAYIDFADSEYHLDIVSLLRNTSGRAAVIFLRTFSKAYGLPGIRLGYGLMNEEAATALHKVRQPFNVNSLAQAAGIAALSDETTYRENLAKIKKGRTFLRDGLQQLGCIVHPSQTNFLLFDTGCDANALYQNLLEKGMIIRSMASYGLPQHIRVTCGTDLENLRFLEMFETAVAELKR